MSKFKKGDEVCWKNPPVSVNPSEVPQISPRDIGIITSVSKHGYSVTFNENDIRSTFKDKELTRPSKLLKVLK